MYTRVFLEEVQLLWEKCGQKHPISRIEQYSLGWSSTCCVMVCRNVSVGTPKSDGEILVANLFEWGVSLNNERNVFCSVFVLWEMPFRPQAVNPASPRWRGYAYRKLIAVTLNAGHCTCQANAYSTELFPHPSLLVYLFIYWIVYVFNEWGSCESFTDCYFI